MNAITLLISDSFSTLWILTTDRCLSYRFVHSIPHNLDFVMERWKWKHITKRKKNREKQNSLTLIGFACDVLLYN